MIFRVFRGGVSGFVPSYMRGLARLANPTLTISLTLTPQPDPNAIANANPDPRTPADRVVPINGWRLVIVLFACRTRAGAHLYPIRSQHIKN